METCKVFSIQDGNYLAIAEFSKISYIEVFEFLDGLVMDKLSDRLPKKNWNFFDRDYSLVQLAMF